MGYLKLTEREILFARIEVNYFEMLGPRKVILEEVRKCLTDSQPGCCAPGVPSDPLKGATRYKEISR